jgi:hypothetical protein
MLNLCRVQVGAFLFASLLQLTLIADDVLKKSTEITFRNSAQSALFDLGELPCGQTLKLELELINKTSIVYPVVKFQTTCSCIKAVLKENSIPADGSGHLDVELKTEKSERVDESKRSLVMSLFYSEKEAIQIRIEYRLTGVLSFGSANTFVSQVARGAKLVEFEIPCLVTNPIRSENIVVSTGPLLQGLKGKIVKKGDLFSVACSMKLDRELTSSIVERVIITDLETGNTATIPVVIDLRNKITLVPSVISFSPDSDKQTRFVGRVIVKLDDSVAFSGVGKDAVEFEPVVTFSTTEGKLKVLKISRAGKGVYRIDLEWTREKQDKLFDSAISAPKQAEYRIASPLASLDGSVGLQFLGY